MGRRDGTWPPAPEPLPGPVVDNHTHLDAVLAETDAAGWRTAGEAAGEAAGDAPPAEPEADAVARHLAAAAAAGVTRVVQVGCDLPSAQWTARLVREHTAVVGAVAIHPNEAVLHAGVREVAPDGLAPAPRDHHDVGLDDAIAQVAAVAAAEPRIRVIGETGLDHFRAGERGRAVQREAFRAHVALAKELDLVLQIHDRDAHEEVLEVLAADGAPDRTVFHCYSGDAPMARFCAAQGWYLSFAGPVTFRANTALREALHAVPLSQVLLETDAPYLTAHPLRGRPNAPAFLALTARAVARELGRDLAEVCAVVSSTSEELYGPW